MTPPNMGGEYNPLTGETDPPHYPDLPPGPHDLNRDFTSPLHQQGSPGSLVIGKYEHFCHQPPSTIMVLSGL